MIVAGSRVAVVGGSVAGCAAAIALGKAGCDVQVYERTRGQLTDRGAGIILPPPLLERLVAGGYLDADLPWERIGVRTWCTLDRDVPPGRAIWAQPFSATCHNWALPWRALRARVPDDRYHEGAPARVVAAGPDGATLELGGGRRERFDAVVGADGYRSAVRAAVEAASRPEYAGYVLWRGGYPVAAATDPGVVPLLSGDAPTCLFPGGHGIFYLIPDHAGGGRRVNWAVYTPTPPGLSFADPSSLPPGAVAAEARAFLFPLLAGVLPPTLLAAVLGSRPEEVFLQPIYDLTMPAYVRDRVLLVGDSGTVARPHTAAGAAKALADALALEQACAEHPSWDGALAAYDTARQAYGADLVTLGRRLGRLLVDESADWTCVTEAEFSHLVSTAQDASAAYPYRRRPEPQAGAPRG